MSKGSLTITNALIFDGESADLVEGSIRVADGEVVEIGGSTISGDAVIDARGAVVAPGLIDAHFHAYGIELDMLKLEGSPLSYVALAASHRLGAALRRGFTTVRDVAGGDAGLARAIGQGLLASPRYLFTGPALSQTGGHGDPRPGDLDVCACNNHATEVVDGVDALRVAVRERLRRGAHAIKIMTSGGVVSLTDPIRIPQYSPEEVRAVAEEATRRGTYVAAHAYSPEAIIHSVTNGVRSIEHGNLLDEEAAAVMAEHDAFLVPTLVAYDAMNRRGAQINMSPIAQQKNSEVLSAGKKAIEIARAAGVRIGFGSDLMGELENDQLQGLRLQAEVEGVLQVLRSATSVNAELIGRSDLGRIAVGAQADLLIFDGDPFDTPSLLWEAAGRRVVIQSGLPL
jgi:imidazolonepropionase-like amidohydrolase